MISTFLNRIFRSVKIDPEVFNEVQKDKNATLSAAIVVILSIFSGFKYPWKWIDALYETENEKIEIIENKWNNAYRPLIAWCANNSQFKKKLWSKPIEVLLFRTH